MEKDDLTLMPEENVPGTPAEEEDVLSPSGPEEVPAPDEGPDPDSSSGGPIPDSPLSESDPRTPGAGPEPDVPISEPVPETPVPESGPLTTETGPEPDAPVSEPVPEKSPEPDINEKILKKKSRKGLWLILIALLLLIGAGCAWFFLLGPGARRCTVTFDTAGGTEAVPVTVLYGKEAALPDVSREGYTLKGWTLNGIDVKEPFIPKADVTLTAVWEGNLHTVRFDSVGGVPADTQLSFRTGDAIELPSEPTKTGYAFLRWEDASGKELTAGTVMPDEDLSVHAVWMAKSFKVTFNTDGGSTLTPLILNDGVPLPNVQPKKENYIFDHWEDKNGKTVKAGDILPCEDITLYAKYKRQTFKVSFDSKGGSTVPSITVNAGDTLKLPANPTRSGYEFVCWQDKNSTPIYDGALLTPEDITLYAVWKETKVYVTGITLEYNSLVLGPNTSNVVITAKVSPSSADDTSIDWNIVGDVDTSGYALAMKAPWGENQMVFQIGTRGRSKGGTFTVQAVAKDGSGVKSETVTVTVEPVLSVSAASADYAIEKQDGSGDNMLTLWIHDKKGYTTVRANQAVTWVYDESHGVVDVSSEGSDYITFMTIMVGTGSYYTGDQIKAKTAGGQEYTIVLNPVP